MRNTKDKPNSAQPHSVEMAISIVVLFAKLAIELKSRLIINDFFQDQNNHEKLLRYVSSKVPELCPLLNPSTTIREAANETVWKAKNLYEKHCSRPPFDIIDINPFPSTIEKLRQCSQHYEKSNHSKEMSQALASIDDPSFYVPKLDNLYEESSKAATEYANKKGWTLDQIETYLDKEAKKNTEEIFKRLKERGIVSV